MTVSPTTRKGRATRQQLIDAGREVFAEDGYVAATMSAVAESAGMSMGALYRYFRNKDDLFESVIHGVHNELFEQSVSRDHHLGQEPYEALLEANLGYLQVYAEHRDVMRAFLEAAHVNERFRDFWWEMRERHIVRFLGAMNHLQPGKAQAHRLAAEAMASLVEQSAYVWFSQSRLAGREVSVPEAAAVVTKAWHASFFTSDPDSHRGASSR